MPVANELLALARRHQQVPVAVTKTGRVLAKEDGVLVDIESGQLVEEEIVSLVDDVYEPFLLETTSVPRLLRPQPRVAVHPGVARGLPCIAGTRVTVRAVAHVLAAARAGAVADPVREASETFGLEELQILDAERVANAISAVG